MGIAETVEYLRHGAMAVVMTPSVPKGVLHNIVEKVVIVSIGCGIVLWANDQRQDDKLSALIQKIDSVDKKVDGLDQHGSRPVIRVEQQITDMNARLRLIEERVRR